MRYARLLEARARARRRDPAVICHPGAPVTGSARGLRRPSREWRVIGVASNAPFTPNEQSGISRRLDEIKKLVRERFELTNEQLAVIDQRLDDAEEASKRLGRKDWVMMFYGAVMSTFMTDAVPPTVIQTVLTTMVHGIAHIFGFGGPPPIIST